VENTRENEKIFQKKNLSKKFKIVIFLENDKLMHMIIIF